MTISQQSHNDDITALESDPQPLQDAVDRIAQVSPHDAQEKASAISAEDAASATEWFLAEDPGEISTRAFELNVAPPGERWVTFKVCAIDRRTLSRIRRSATPRGAAANTAQVDDMKINLQIAVAGLVEPSQPTLTSIKPPNQERPFVDPADGLAYRLRHKPGLIDQIAAEVLSASGYDDEDVRRAAGN